MVQRSTFQLTELGMSEGGPLTQDFPYGGTSDLRISRVLLGIWLERSTV